MIKNSRCSRSALNLTQTRTTRILDKIVIATEIMYPDALNLTNSGMFDINME